MNVKLDREADYDDFDHAVTVAKGECVCTAKMNKRLKHGDETICRHCAARQVLNGLTSLYDEQ